MTKIQVTAQQRANALDALNNMWPSVPPENVKKHLSWWREDRESNHTNTPPDCGAVACFGGWCAWWPAFRAQGVTSSSIGAPRLKGSPFSVATVLFGDFTMFYPSGEHEGDGGPKYRGTDHELVTKRLNWLIQNSEVVS